MRVMIYFVAPETLGIRFSFRINFPFSLVQITIVIGHFEQIQDESRT